MTSRDTAAKHLQNLGFTSYESKAYVALLMAGEPITGYEVAKRSGIPRSAVYETLQKLVEHEVAFQVSDKSDNQGFLALPAESLLRSRREDFNDAASAFEDSINDLEPPSTQLIHRVAGRGSILARARDLIRSSEEQIYAFLWPSELIELEKDLQKARNQGVYVALLTVGGVEASILEGVRRHPTLCPNADGPGRHLFIVVGDQSQALFGEMNIDEAAVYSDDPGVSYLAYEYVTGHLTSIQTEAVTTSSSEAEQ